MLAPEGGETRGPRSAAHGLGGEGGGVRVAPDLGILPELEGVGEDAKSLAEVDVGLRISFVGVVVEDGRLAFIGGLFVGGLDARGRGRDDADFAVGVGALGDFFAFGLVGLVKGVVGLLLPAAVVDVEGDGFLFLPLFEPLDRALEVGELIERFLATLAGGAERRDEGGLKGFAVEETRGDFVPDEGVWEV